MLTVLAFAILYGGYRANRAALDLPHRLPRSNEDMIFY